MIMEYGIIAEAAGPNPGIAWNVILTIGVIVAIGANLASLIRKPTTAITPDPLRIEKLDKFATRDFCEMKHGETKATLGRHDLEISELWRVIRSENENIRDEVRKGFQSMERSLGRIEGTIKNQSNDTRG
jgi:hypothetical protein